MKYLDLQVAVLLAAIIIILFQRMSHHLKENILKKLSEGSQAQQQAFNEHRARFDERQMETFKILHDMLQSGMHETRQNVKESLAEYANILGKRVEALTQTTDSRLKKLINKSKNACRMGLKKRLKLLPMSLNA